MPNITCLAPNIRAYRKQKKLTQKGLANALWVSYQTISAWERGQSIPDLMNTIQLADFFGISLDQLLSPLEVTTNL